MKKFNFNKSNVCTNPNVIFRTTNKKISKYQDQTPNSFTIKTALNRKGKWVYGYAFNAIDGAYHSPCAGDSEEFETENKAISQAIRDIAKQMDYFASTKYIVGSGFDASLRKMLKECSLANIQLSLF